MVQVVKLLQLSNISDIEVSSGIKILKINGEEWVFFGWYHDTQYGSDEYGCTSTPNIFHNWLMKRSDLEAGKTDHINITGSECNSFITLGVQYLPSRKWLMVHGYTYTSGGTGYPRLAIYDVSDPNNPQVVKDIQSSSSVSSVFTHALYNEKHDKILISWKPTLKLYYGSFNDLLNASKIEDLPNVIDGYDVFYSIDDDRVIVCDNAHFPSTCYIMDLDTMQIETSGINLDLPKTRTINYLVTLAKSDSNNIVVQFRSLNDLSVIKSYDLGVSWGSKTPQPMPIGDDVAVFDFSNSKIHVVNKDNGLVQTIDLPKVCVEGDISNDGTIICADFNMAGNSINKLVADIYYKVIFNGASVCIEDNQGQPLANKNIYVGEIGGTNQLDRWQMIRGYSLPSSLDSKTTGSDGCIDLSEYNGKAVVIIVPP
ncbi:hypothetical protein J7M00_06795 [bacterium]|nr:hypothetical protein [bacterium]